MQSFRFSDQSFVSKFLSLTTFNNADSITFNNADLIKSALLKVVNKTHIKSALLKVVSKKN